MQTKPDTLGAVVKDARQALDITIEKAADKIGITERYLYRIENEGKKPSYEVLFDLIRELAIDPRLIFQPELQAMDDEVGDILRMLCICDKRSLSVVKATIQALIDSASER